MYVAFVPRGQFFVHFFLGKISGKIPRKIFPQKCWGKMEFSMEKVLKNRFSNSAEFSAESDFPWKKNVRKIGPRYEICT
jgi:hypothetical protein